MRTTITFDTQELVRELRTAGLLPEQAEAVVRTIVKSQSELATHADLERLEMKLERRMDGLDGKMDKLIMDDGDSDCHRSGKFREAVLLSLKRVKRIKWGQTTIIYYNSLFVTPKQSPCPAVHE